MNKRISGPMKSIFALLILFFSINPTSAQTTAFTYQGKLTDAGNPANGNYDLQFKLFDALSGGAQQGTTQVRNPITITAGVFTVTLDFSPVNVFNGANRYLEIGVRPANSVLAYTVLAPRQPITSSPYAIQTLNAQQLGGLPASAYLTTASANNSFIKNDTAQQSGANLNISGNGLFGGNVGIGTTIPQSKLAVQASGYGITQTDGTVTVGSFISNAAGGSGWFGTKSNHPLNFFTFDGLPQMTLATNSNVGIGTTTPATKLEVIDPVRQLRFGPTTADNGGYLVSTNPSQAITAGGARWDGANWIARDTVASLTANQNGTIQFLTNGNLNVGSPFNPTLRMQIDVNGRVVIGRPNTLNTGQLQVTTDNDVAVVGTSTNGTGVVGEGEHFPGVQGFSGASPGVVGNSIFGAGVYGYSEYSYAGSFAGNVFVTGTVTQGSDARLKQGIRTLNYGLAEVLHLRPVTWRWKDHPERGQQLGLVAQEVEPVLPELVSTDKNAEQTKGLNYTGLVPVLVNAIQEQQAQIELQRQQLKTQQTRIERQQREIGELMRAVKTLKSSIRNPRHK